jgi:chromosome partitioning protein
MIRQRHDKADDMFSWLKRIKAGAQQQEPAEHQIVSTEEKIDTLVCRLDHVPERVENIVPLIPDNTTLVPTVSSTRVIAIAAQKGGAGKTTIAAHLAVHALRCGAGPVVLADTDPQGSLTQWWRARNDPALALATVTLDDLAANPAALRSRGAAVAIVDTPPALTMSIERVVGLADLVLIPARPSPHDLRAIGATVELVRRAGKPFVFVVNGAAPRANITAEAVAALSEHGQVAPVILYQRSEFAASMIDGRTVIEVSPNGRSAREIADLWNYVYGGMSIRQAA